MLLQLNLGEIFLVLLELPKVGLLLQNLVKIFLVLWELPKVELLLQNLGKIFLVLWELPKLGLLYDVDKSSTIPTVGITKSRVFATRSR